MRRTRTMVTVAPLRQPLHCCWRPVLRHPRRPSPVGAAKGTTVPTGGTASNGGTATWAELPGSPPNFIFPFDPPGLFSVPNISQFQYLMYRPLYWFGQGTTARPQPFPVAREEPRLLQRVDDHHHRPQQLQVVQR